MTSLSALSAAQIEKLHALLERDAIADVLKLYCRAIDRRDRALLERVYWPDARDDHATFTGTPAEFIDYAFAHTGNMATSHMIMNMLIDLRGQRSAFSECYFCAYHNFPSSGGRMDRTVGGRYLDHFEKRGDEWRIISRVLCIDWYTEHSATSEWETGRYANLRHRGGAKPQDPLYTLAAIQAEQEVRDGCPPGI